MHSDPLVRCAVRELPVPQIPQGPTTSTLFQRRRFLRNVHTLMLDAATMPALGEYHPQYLTDLCRVRKATRKLHAAVAELDDTMSDLIHNYSGRQVLPEYFHELCRDFSSQI